MKIVLSFIAVFILLASPQEVIGQTSQCVRGVESTSNGWLYHSIVATTLRHPNLRIQIDDHACPRRARTIEVLKKTFGRNYLTSLERYEFTKIINGDEYFTVEHFSAQNSRDVRALSKAMSRNKSKKFSIEENTGYEYFLISGGIVIMTFSVTGQAESRVVFSEIQTLMLESASSATK